MKQIDEDELKRTAIRAAACAAILWAVLLALTSCKSMQPVVVTQTRDSIRVQYVEKVDSVWRDRYHTVQVAGDTVFVRDSVWVYKYKFLTKTDSVVLRDSIPYPVEVTKEVRVRNAYDRATARGFWILLAMLIATVAWKVFRKYYLHM